jgi:DNA-binding NarL/FixJ family response regulator
MIKVMVVDDQELIRESLTMMLTTVPQIQYLGCAENGKQAIELAEALKPDVILMDVRMAGIDGIECSKIIIGKNPKTKIIILTTFEDDEYIYNSLKNGVSGFLLKGISKNELINSIITVYNGGATIQPEIISKVFSLFCKMAKSYYLDHNGSSGIDRLNANELKIIQLIGRGLSNKEIMHEIHLSEGTVRNYISNILDVLGLRDRTQIAIYAIQSGLMLKDLDEE